MAKDIVDLYAESDRGIISDDSGSTLRLENTSTGNVLTVKNTAGGGIQISSVSAPTVAIKVVAATSAVTVAPAVEFLSAASLGNSISVGNTVIASPTVANIVSLNSAASGAHFEFKGFLASAASMGSIVRGVRVKYGDSYGWIPVYASATFI